MTSTRERPSAKPASVVSAIAVAIVLTLGVLYVVSQFLRNSVGVIAPNLAAELHLSPIELGVLSSTYFLCFTAVQLPLGVALDRFGPKRCMLASIALTVLGCVVFAMATSQTWLVTARVLFGVGTASSLMAPVALYARWFPPERFATLAGIHLGLGSLGVLFATAPLALVTAGFGWRAAFVGVGVLTVVIGILILFVVSDDPPGAKPVQRRETLRESVAGIWEVIRTPSMGRIMMVQLTCYPSFVLLTGLWGGPYLTHVYGYDLAGRGNILFVSALAQVAGSFFWGPSERLFGNRRVPILLGTVFSFLALALLAGSDTLPVPLLLVAFTLIGCSTGITSLVMSHGRRLVAPHLLGRCITLLNIGTMGGGFLVQFVSGAIIDQFPSPGGISPPEAYRLVFGLQAALVLIGACVYFGSKDKNLAKS